jgi:hypothetical protein
MKINFYKNIKVMLLVLVTTFLANASFAQAISGVKTIDPAGTGANNYVSFSSAIDSLNKYGVGTGGVTYNVTAGATFAETNALVLKATGTAANPIVFQKSGTGANPIIQPKLGSIATGTLDYSNGDVALKIVGSDYVTWDAINIIEPAGLGSVALTEYGIAILQASPTNGCKNITIKNSKISLSRTTLRSWGIWESGSYGETFVLNAATSTGGRNENIFITNNIIDNCYSGVYAYGSFASAAPYSLYDNNIVIRNNTISNFSGSTATAYAFYGVYLDSLQFSNNIISNGTGHTTTLYGFYGSSGTNSSLNIDSNNINLVTSATTSQVSGIYSFMGGSGTTNISNMRGNRVKINSTTMTSGLVYAIYNTGGAYTQNMSGNTISGCSFGTTAVSYTGTMYMFYFSLNNVNTGSTTTIENNTLRDITRLQTAAGGTGTFYGFYNLGEAQTSNIRNNKVLNLSLTNTTSSLYMMYWTGSSLTRNINNNTIDSIYTGGGTMYGMYTTSGTVVNVYNNLIRGIASNKSTSTAGIVYGLYTAGGTTLNIYNNIVADLRAPFATSINAVHGISLQGGTTINLSYNTVYLSGTGATTAATTFGSSAMFYTTSVGSLISKNNIFYNTCIAGPAGVVSAIRRNAVLTTTPNYNGTSNNNIYYAGAVASGKYLIYWDGTTGLTGKDSVLASYKTRVASADALSLAGALAFSSTTAPMNLHINGTSATLVESSAQPVAGITTDFDGDVRDVNSPDVGADEGTFTAGPDIQGPGISYTALAGTGFLTNRTLSVNITDRTGINTTTGTSPRLYFRKRENIDNTYNGNTSATTGWKYVESTNTTSPFSFTIDYSLLNVTPVPGDTIQYFVVAQDAVTTPNFSINSGILTTPSTVALTSANFPVTGNINQYKLLPQVSAVITVGTGGTYPNLTGATVAGSGGGAFEYINGSVVTQNITIQVLSHLDETGVVGLQQFTEEGAGAGTYRIKIVPAAASEDSIRGSFSGSMVRLNQADRVTIDGSFAGTGNYLVFANHQRTGSSAALQLTDGGSTTNGCNNIIIKNCTFTARPMVRTGSAIQNVGITLSGTGGPVSGGGLHDNVTIDSCIFTGLYYGIWASGNNPREYQNLKIRWNTMGSVDNRLDNAGIYVSGANKALIFKNTIFGIRSLSTSLRAMLLGGNFTNSRVDGNVIYDITYYGTGGWQSRGIDVAQFAANANDTIVNNMISGVRADGYGSINYAGVGMYINSGSGYLIANNSINMYGFSTNLSYSTQSITAGFYASTTPSKIDFRNNLCVNNLNSPNAAGQSTAFNAAAWFNGSVGNGGQVTALDNNNYNVDLNPRGFVMGVGNLFYPDITTYSLALGTDKNSFSDIPRFVDSNNLHINAGTTGTLLESHGQNIVGLNRDIDGQVRPGPAGSVNGGAIRTDIGADELDGVYLADVFAPTVLIDSISPPTGSCAQKAHTFYFTVYDLGGVDTAQVFYTVKGVLQAPFLATKTAQSKYRAVIPAVAPGSEVKVYMFAKDSVGNKQTKLYKTYTDAKFFFTATTNADTIALGSTVGLNANMPNTTVNMSGPTVISSTGYPSPYNTTYWGNKEQFLYTAAELTAKGFVAGKITELGLQVGAVTTTLPLTNFTISMGHTSNTALSGFITSGLNTVYMSPSYTILPNQVNTHTFQTSFIWDGVSNVVIETCFNNSAWNGSQTIYYSTTANVSCVYSYADAAGVCASPGSAITSSNRPNFIISQPLQATYNWTSSANGGLTSTNIINPNAIPTGAAGLYSYILSATNAGCTWTDTVDVRVITAVTPSAGFRTDTIAGVAGAKPTTINVINTASNFPNTWDYTVTPNTYIYVNNTTAASRAPKLQFTRAGVYSIKQKVQNTAGTDSLTRTNYITISLKYCDAASTYTGYNYISTIGLTSMNVTSGLTGLPSYNNYSDSTSILPASLQGGRFDTLKFRLAAGSYGWASNNATAAWIDYNRNGQFENSEKLGEISIALAANTGNIIFKVPYTAESGITRMRVRTDSYNSTGVGACGTSNYGEIEDYAINIAAAPLMVLNRTKVEQDTVAVLPATTNAVVLRSKVVVTGYTNRLSLTSLSLSTAGTTNLADVTSIKIYSTGNVDTFNTATPIYTTTPAATIVAPVNVLLEGDTNYIWVAYDVASAAVVGNTMDAAITSMTIGSTTVTPTNSSPAGVKKILSQATVNAIVGFQPFNAVPVYAGTFDNPVIAAKITMNNGVLSNLTELKFALANTKLAGITSVRLMYTGKDSTYTGSKKQVGSIPLSYSGTITFTDNVKLGTGANYFWLVATMSNSAATGDTLDATFVSAKVQGSTIASTLVAPAGVRKVEAFPITGCVSTASFSGYENIGYVKVGNFENQSTPTLAVSNNQAATQLYSNFGSLPGLTMQVEIPIAYNVGIVSKSTFLYSTTVNIFVDLNQNGTFDLPRERIAKKVLPTLVTDRNAIGNMKLPIGTKGGKTVMRIVAQSLISVDTTAACATYNYGETEDYIISVLPAPPGDYYAPIISNVTLTPDSSCISVAHTIGATIKDTTGVDSVWINWTKDGSAQTAIVMTSQGNNLYSGIIPAQGRSVVRFSLLAQDNSPRANESTTKSDVYRDEYLKAALNAGPDGYVAAGNGYQIDGAIKREPSFGNGTSSTPVYGFYRYYGAMKYQEILTAAELQAAGLTAGAINTIAWNTTGTQSTDTMSDFTVSMGNTTQADVSSGFITAGLTQVINPGRFIPRAGGYSKSAVPFNTNFIWDGVSNIVVSWCWSNNDGGTSSSSTNPYVYYTFGFSAGISRYYYLDNVTSTTACGWSTEGFSTTARTDIMLKQALPYTYNWTQSTNGGLSALNIPNPIATPTGGVGAYQYVVTVGDGTCTANDTVIVNVLPVPTVDLGPSTGLICGSTPRLLDAGNPDAASYAWYINNAIDANTTRTMLASTAGVYKVVVRDRAGQTAVDSISFTAGAAFTYNIGVDTLGLCVGGTRTLDPGTYPSYLWSTGATTRTLAVSTTGIYSLTVTNAGGCIATDTFTVVSVNPTTVSLGADQAICTSAPLTLDAGNAGATYLWSTGATTQTIQAKFAGTYSVIVNTVTGCTLNDTIVITNLPAPSVSIGPDFQLCPGSTSVLDAGNAGSTFLWSTAATTQTITISSAGTYYVTVTSANGCQTNDTIVVTPKTAPVVSLGADQNICTSDTVTLDAGNAGATYLWSTGATTQTIKVSLANTYSVAVTNVGGCTTNDAVVITNKAVPVSSFTTQVVDTTKGQQVKFTAVAAAGTSYAWNFGDPTSASNTSSLSTPTHLFSAPGNYTVTLTVTNVATGCKSVTQTAVSVTGLANDFAKAFKLVAAPNPFAGNTKINYELPSNANVTLEVYDMIGRKVSTIANAAYQESGVHTYDFSAGDNQNASGVYMVRLIVDGQVAILRVIDIANR